ncbi:hypothetical protein [Candidatus Magnetominusculus xianensis]|uniref:Phage tail tape measure protein n=1 Tax=Candidatus Magnetominusculus xianensis TaxID=1748249 RepID=A0ABR5SBF7_9BACT|nr:hypothetical protein [Candidatus Magnetominusculus xianensis]KWT77351.1 phage tail tape measure protein [Candidatus Magnetominusculus xianensis]MBF0404966.1 hypothetical protein [Nitrospirota bacterium]
MAAQTLKFVIEAVTKGFDKLQNLLSPLNNGLTTAREQIQSADSAFKTAFQKTGTEGSFSGITSSLGSFMVSIGAAAAAYKGFQALLSVSVKGFEFNREMETSKIGIASIITATTELISQDGRRLTGMEKFNEAQKVAAGLMKELQIAGLETTATTQQLVEAFQSYIGPATAAGLTMKQTKEFTLLMVQGLGALGIEMNQLSAEGRSLLDGSIVPMQDRLATALGITGQMVDKWKSSGTYWQELTKKLEAFKLSGEAVANTWAGLASNMKDAISFIGGKMTEGLFDGIKTSWKALLTTLIDAKNFDVGSGIKNLFAGAKAVADDIGKLLVAGVQDFIGVLKEVNGYIEQHKKEFIEVYESVKNIGLTFIDITATALTFLAYIIKIAFESGALVLVFKTIHAALAAMLDVIDLAKLAFLSMAFVITSTVQSIFMLTDAVHLTYGAQQLIWDLAVKIGNEWEKTANSIARNPSHLSQALDLQNKIGESAKKTATAQAKGTAEVQAQAKAADLLKTAMEGVDKKYQETLEYLESTHSTRTFEIEMKFTGMEAGTARDKAVYLALLSERQKYYQDLIAEAEKYNTKQQAVADKETANMEAAYKRQEIAVANTMQKIAQNFNDPVKVIELTKQLGLEQKVLDGIRQQQAEIVKVKIEKAREAMAGIGAALKETEQKEKEYAEAVKKLNNEILTSEVSLASEVSSIKQTRMSVYMAAQEKDGQARKLEAEAEKQAAKGNLDIAKQLYGEAKAMYSDLAKSAGNSYVQYATGLNGVERAGKKYIDILKQEKAEAQSRWETEQKNATMLKEALEALAKPLLDLKAQLESLRAQGEINFKATGLTEIEDRIKAIIANDGKQVVIKVVQETTTTEKKAAGGLVGVWNQAAAFARGGQLPGWGGGDSIRALLEPGEFVIRKEAVAKFGAGLFHMLNSLKMPDLSSLSRFKITPPAIPSTVRQAFAAGGMVTGGAMEAGGSMMTLNLNIGGTVIKTYTQSKNIDTLKDLNRQLGHKRKTGHQE